MSPREVQGLQALAENHGGSLTINPHTGLPEAGFLDKLLPTIIGAGLTFFGGVPPNVAAMIVGGVQTARTGDIGKGISAGLGAYGGAGLTQGLTAAGASSLTGAGAEAALSAPTVDAFVGNTEGMTSGDAFNNFLKSDANPAVAGRADVLSAGAKEFANDPSKFATKDNFKYLAASAAPILADQAIKSNLPTTTTQPGQIRPSFYDPYSGTYIAGNPYEAQVKKAADGGVMGFDESANSPMSRRALDGMGNTGGMFNYAHDGGGVMKMAQGGIAGYAIGGDTKAEIDAAYAAGDYAKVNELAQANKITAADVADTYKGFDTSGLAGLGINLFTPPAQQAAAAPAYNQYSDQQIGDYLRTNPNADIAGAIKTTNADPAAVNRYLASLDDPFRGSTDTTGGSGTLGIYNQMKALGVDPNELYGASKAFDPNYAGWSAADITKGYNLDKGAYALSDQLKGNVSDKNWAKFMDDNGYSINDMAQAFGLSRNEVKARYDAAKKEPLKPIPFVNPVTGGTILPPTRVTDTVLPTNPTVNAPPGTTNPYGNVNNPGDKTYNADGSITVQPNIPGRPYGGFSGIDEVKDAYTAGGGNLGYIPYAPKTIDEFNTKYNTQTGGSKQAYDYLTGKTPYSPTPYTPTGEVMKPYAESVLGMPANTSKKMYLFDPATKQYKINPDYAIPTYDSKGKKTYNLTNRDVSAYLAGKPSGSDFYTWAKTNNLSVEQIAAATGMPITEIQKMFSGGAPKDETATTVGSVNDSRESGGAAAGGLMALAGGGITGDGNLNLHIPLDIGSGGGGGGSLGGTGGYGGYISGGGKNNVDNLFSGLIPAYGSTGTGNISAVQQNVNPNTAGSGFGIPSSGFGTPGDGMGTTSGGGLNSGVGAGGKTSDLDYVNPTPSVGQNKNPYADAFGGLLSGQMSSENYGPDAMVGMPSKAMVNPYNSDGKGQQGTFADKARQMGMFADGGSVGGHYNLGGYSDGGRLLRGPGDGVSDSIPATIGNRQPARLADGEFVVPARIVSELGNGSTEAGARKLYAMMDRVQAARKGSIGKGKVAKNSRADKHLPV
jgi:hypothetical protein